ncbi:hypothetical protein Bbelb_290990 [Branchiostoma belcheri]|nr:hypothetical protein Bbelb_290990 [Branchiostoma belcheri]
MYEQAEPVRTPQAGSDREQNTRPRAPYHDPPDRRRNTRGHVGLGNSASQGHTSSNVYEDAEAVKLENISGDGPHETDTSTDTETPPYDGAKGHRVFYSTAALAVSGTLGIVCAILLTSINQRTYKHQKDKPHIPTTVDTMTLGYKQNETATMEQRLNEKTNMTEPPSWSASSEFDSLHSADRADINSRETADAAGAWAAATNDQDQWLMRDLGEVSVITGVITKGRNYSPDWPWDKHDQYVTSYTISYSDENGDEKFYTNADHEGQVTVFPANDDRDTEVYNDFRDFSGPITARFVKIHPQTWHGHISMRAKIVTGTECPSGSWTDWFDRDDPTGTADSEILTDLRQDYPGQICVTPTAVHARVISTQQEASLTGQHISSYDTTAGFLCRNVDQPDGVCLDYEVRFCCSDVGKGGWLAQDSSWFLESIGRPHVKDGVTYDATKALDGDTMTYWNPTGTDQSFNNWYIILDLKSSHTLTRIAVNNYGDTTHDTAAFKLQASHVRCPRTWKDVVTITNVQGGARQRQEFGGFQGTARYWRFVVTRTHSGWQPCLTELNFYGIPSGCKAGYTPVVGTCIRLSVRKTSYDVARKGCMNDGGTLAMPKTRGLDVALRNLVKTVGLKQDYWIGMKNVGYKYVRARHWQWEDGRALGNYQQIVPRGGIFLASLIEKITPTPNKTAKEANRDGGRQGLQDTFDPVLTSHFKEATCQASLRQPTEEDQSDWSKALEPLSIAGVPLTEVHVVKLLGMYVQADLGTQVNNIVKKGSQRLFRLRKLTQFNLSRPELLTCYKTFVRPTRDEPGSSLDPARDLTAARPNCKSRSAPYRKPHGSRRETDRAPDRSRRPEHNQAPTGSRKGTFNCGPDSRRTLGFMTPAGVYTEDMPNGRRFKSRVAVKYVVLLTRLRESCKVDRSYTGEQLLHGRLTERLTTWRPNVQFLKRKHKGAMPSNSQNRTPPGTSELLMPSITVIAFVEGYEVSLL